MTEKSTAHLPWMKMDVSELELQYSPSRWSKRFSAEEIINNHVKSATELSHLAQESVSHRLDVSYGDKQKSKLDVFGEDLPRDSPILVYVHGGYWQELDKSLSHYVVQPLYKNGILTVIIGYTLAPESGVKDIVDEVRVGIRWVSHLAQQRNSAAVILMGWSAGAQLISQVLSHAESEDVQLFGCIKGFITLSGVFDLRPLVKTYVNDVLSLDVTTAWEVSPLRSISSLAEIFPDVKALITVGENDSPEFKRQSLQYFHDLTVSGIASYHEEIPDADHFSLMENLSCSDDVLTIKVLQFIQEIKK